jgi:UDP-N-acetylmuramate--alanine ligase
MSLDLATADHVHFVGIGGIGMSALARYLLARGHTVSGSDRAANAQTEALASMGATVHIGHAAEHVDGADLVVMTSAASTENPEIMQARSRGIAVVKRSELLAAVANAGRCIAVAGSHGKTTTSSLVGHILTECGLDPTVLVGGIVNGMQSNARIGEGDWIVVEADEFDRSFLHLRPEVAALTSLEPDHPDIYKDAQAVQSAYREFAAGITGSLIACADDPHMRGVVDGIPARVVTYGTAGTGASILVGEVRDDGTALHFSIERDERTWDAVISLAGSHNALNATAAALVAEEAGVPFEAAIRTLGTFQGVQRRFQIRGEAAGVIVVDDYAVHPTEVRTLLCAAHARVSRPLRVVFQPHTYSRTHAYFDDFARSFDGAEAVYVMDIYAARETETLGVSSPALAAAIAREHGGRVMYTGTESATLDALLRDALPGDAVLTVGAGDVTALGPKLLERLRSR